MQGRGGAECRYPSEGGVVPRVALDLAPGVGDGTDAADRLPGCPLEPP